MPAVAHTSVGSSWRRCSKTRSRLPLSRTNQCSETAPSADKPQVQLPVALRKPIRAITSLDHQICTAPKEEQKTRARSRARIRGSSLLKLPCRRTHHARRPASVPLSSRGRALTNPTIRFRPPPPIMQLDYYTLPRQRSARGGSSASPRRTRKKNNRRGRAPQALQPLCAAWRRRQGRNRGSICLIASSLRSARRSV